MHCPPPIAPAAGDPPGDPAACGLTRRHFLQAGAVAGVAPATVAAQPRDAGATAPMPTPTGATGGGRLRTLRLRVNGSTHELVVEPRVTLLDALRERLALTGTKKGCDRGQCGACTVLVDGRRVNACLTLAVMHEGSEITTIEGLGTPDALHPVQAAFLSHDAFQCGYCTPGQICSTVALVDELKAQTLSAATFEAAPSGSAPRAIPISDAEIRERMSGNLCRCGAYANIVAAVRSVAEGKA